MLASLPPTSDGLVQELREEHSRGARKDCTPRRLLFFLAYISPMTMRKEEPDIYCWGRKELSPLRPASCIRAWRERRKDSDSQEWLGISQMVCRDNQANHGVLWLSMAPASPNCSQFLTAFFRSLRLESFGELLGVWAFREPPACPLAWSRLEAIWEAHRTSVFCI